jgi:hypothetical protein
VDSLLTKKVEHKNFQCPAKPQMCPISELSAVSFLVDLYLTCPVGATSPLLHAKYTILRGIRLTVLLPEMPNPKETANILFLFTIIIMKYI